jgi:hypothetical protein
MPKETNEMEKSVEAKLGSARGEAEGARRGPEPAGPGPQHS